MVNLFLGYDAREAIGYHACLQSILAYTDPLKLAITALRGDNRDGSSAFTYARFLVPYLCGYKGTAVFLDGSDMIARRDLRPLFNYALDPTKAVHVVKHHYTTMNYKKYIGTPMECVNESYPRKNWSSVMVFNCAHQKHRQLHPDSVASMEGPALHQFKWLADSEIGALPDCWNVLIGEDRDDRECAIAHFTLGIPAFDHYKKSRYSDEWDAHARAAMTGLL